MVEKADPSGAPASLGTKRVNSGDGSLVDKGKKIVTKFQDMPAKAGITACSEEKKSGRQGHG
jgi:hypothetical protein